MLSYSKFYDVVNSLQHSHLPNSKFSYKYALLSHSKDPQEKKLSHGGNIYELRSWIYAHKYSAGVVTNEFLNGT